MDVIGAISRFSCVEIGEVSRMSVGLRKLLADAVVTMRESFHGMREGAEGQAALVEQMVGELATDTEDLVRRERGFQHFAAELDEVLRGLVDRLELMGATSCRMTALAHRGFAYVEEISQIAKRVGDIADQTRWLSLNARIEAAHAGDAGSGFEVVATEVKNLANDAADAAQRISDAVDEAKKVSEQMSHRSAEVALGEARGALEAGERVGEIMREVSELNGRAMHAFEQISQLAQKLKRDAARAVMSLQFEDIARQQLEFVEATLSRVTDVLTVLDCACRESDGSSTDSARLAADLRGVLERTRGSEIRNVAHQTDVSGGGGCDFF